MLYEVITEFKVFRMSAKDTNSLSSNLLVKIDGDSDGNLWIGTLDKGVCMYNTTADIFTNYLNRITSYNVCYTKLLRSTKRKRNLTYFTTVHKADVKNIKLCLAMK